MSRDEAEALRKRLYAPDASADDVERYRTAAVALPPQDPAPARSTAAVAEDERPAPPRRRAVLVAVAALLVLVVGAGVAAVRIAQAQQPTSLRPPVALAADRVEREAFLENLALGNHAGIAAYLVTHRDPLRLPDATRYYIVERDGLGAKAIDLAPVPADAVQGRATVLVVLGGEAQVGWTAYRRRVDAAGEQQYVRSVTRGGPQTAGGITATTFRYRSGDRPVRLVLDVPDGVRWGAAVVFSD